MNNVNNTSRSNALLVNIEDMDSTGASPKAFATIGNTMNQTGESTFQDIDISDDGQNYKIGKDDPASN